MAFDINRFRTDETKEVEGVWSELGDGARIKVARIGNPEWLKQRRAFEAPHRDALAAGALPQELSEQIAVKAMARSILVDWEGIYEGAKPVKYSVADAERLLAIKDFRALVMDLAVNQERFRLKTQEQDAKN